MESPSLNQATESPYYASSGPVSPAQNMLNLAAGIVIVLSIIAVLAMSAGTGRNEMTLFVAGFGVPFVLLGLLAYGRAVRRAGLASRKAADFLSGSVGTVAIAILVSWVFSDGRYERLIPTALFVAFAAVLGGLIHSITSRRRYIWIGIVSIVAISLLSFGACAMVFLGVML